MTDTGWLLAVETSGARGGVALLHGRKLVAAAELPGERSGGLLPLVREVLARGGCRAAELAAYCFSRGPGSFTGLRTAATLGRMLAATVGCRVLGVPTLEVIASNALEELARLDPPANSGVLLRPFGEHPQGPARERHPAVLAMIAAQRGRVYAAAFRPRVDGALEEILPAGVHDPERLLASLEPPLVVLGAGVATCRPACEARGARILDEALWNPTAVQVARIALRRLEADETPSPAESLPLYLRPPECEEVYEQRRAEARRRRDQPGPTPLPAAE